MRTILKKILAAVLRFEASLVLRRYRPRVIAITGSVGKTSTKDAVFAVVAPGVRARKSEKSFNSELGLPLTILGRPNAWGNPLRWAENIIDGLIVLISSALPAGRQRYPEWLVLEVGADRPGDISSLESWLATDVAVITRLPEVPVHVEFFSSPQAVKEEKASLLNTLKPGGAAVLYGDDPEVAALRERVPGARVLTFGFSEGVDVRAHDVSLLTGRRGEPAGMRALVRVEGHEGVLEIRGAIGAHAIMPALAAVAVGKVLGKDLPAIVLALKSYEPPRGRMRLVSGGKDTLIIDDTYNSSPAAVAAALDTLGALPHGRKIAVLGDMLELGRHSSTEHKKAGAKAAQTADLLVTVGFRARDIAQGAQDSGMPEKLILQYEHAERAGKELKTFLEPGDIVLIKGSQSIRMEKIVEELMEEPERAPELLVRQDAEWKRR
jgi:UDP-N-acetylmuramoyl-tripeptide--D-alanyl-D-alanine ligase